MITSRLTSLLAALVTTPTVCAAAANAADKVRVVVDDNVRTLAEALR